MKLKPRLSIGIVGFGLVLWGALLSSCRAVESLAPRPDPGSITEQIREVCFSQQLGEPILAQVSTTCSSTTCTRPVLRQGSLIIDRQAYSLRFDASWVLEETSGFPFGCSDDCMGGGTLDFEIEPLIPGDWTVHFGEDEIGTLFIFSGREFEYQCHPPG